MAKNISMGVFDQLVRIVESKAQLLDPEINPEMYSRKIQNNKFAELICEVTAQKVN